MHARGQITGIKTRAQKNPERRKPLGVDRLVGLLDRRLEGGAGHLEAGDVDADLAANTLGWQWAAGCGAGEAAGVAASLAIKHQLPVQRVDYGRLRSRLTTLGVKVERPASPARKATASG